MPTRSIRQPWGTKSPNRMPNLRTGRRAPSCCPSLRILPRRPRAAPGGPPCRAPSARAGHGPGTRPSSSRARRPCPLWCRGVPSPLRHRHRLPRRRPRGLHGRPRPHRRRASTSTRPRSTRSTPARRRCSSPAWTSCSRGSLATGRLRFTTDYAEVAHARACTSSAWAPPSAAARTPPTPPTSTPRARPWPRT